MVDISLLEPSTVEGRQSIIDVRPLSEQDLPAVAQIHLQAFPNSAISRLGLEAARRYYEWQLTGPHQVVALGAFDGATVLGFCIGGIFRGALSGFLHKNRAYLGRRVLTHPWLFANPIFRDRFSSGLKILLRRIRRLRPKALGKDDSVQRPKPTSFGILALASAPHSQHKGVGTALLQGMEEAAHRRGFRELHLTVHSENLRAIRFYERHHWQKVCADGQWNGRMTKSIER